MDLCSITGATVVNSTGQYGLPRASCQRIVDDSAPNAEKGEDLGLMPISCALGVTALPAPASTDGTSAEGIFETDVGGFTAAVVAAWDARCTEVAGQLSPGDTCLHGTHTDSNKRAKVFCKEDLLALLVGNDLALTLDRGGEAVTLAAFGHVVQISKDGGILFAEKSGGNWIELKGGNNSIVGPTCIGGPGATPLLQSTGFLTAFAALISAVSSMGTVTGSTLASALTTFETAVAATSVTKQTMAT